jgi:hypothetical protein
MKGPAARRAEYKKTMDLDSGRFVTGGMHGV